MTKQMTIVVIGSLRVKFIFKEINFQIYFICVINIQTFFKSVTLCTNVNDHYVMQITVHFNARFGF